MKKVVFALIVLVACAFGQDIYQQAYTPFVQFRNIPWGNGAGAVNNTFWFNSLAPEDGVCVAIYNNDPTNAHSFTLAVSQSSDPATQGFTGFSVLWTPVPGTVAFPFNLPANTSTSLFYATRSAAFVALTFSNSNAPSTANIIAVEGDVLSCAANAASNSVQGIIPSGNGAPNIAPVLVGGWKESGGYQFTTAQMSAVDSSTYGWLVGMQNSIGSSDFVNSNYYAGASPFETSGQSAGLWTTIPFGSQDDSASPGPIGRFKNSKNFGLMSSNHWQWASNFNDHLAFESSNDAVNPAAGFMVIGLNTNANNTGLFPYRFWLSCSVACDLKINRTSDTGTTCSSGTRNKAFEQSLTVPGGITVIIGSCVTNPTVLNQISHIYLSAGVPQLIDMSGYWMGASSSSTGFDVVNNTLIAAGTVSVTMEWEERGW